MRFKKSWFQSPIFLVSRCAGLKIARKFVYAIALHSQQVKQQP